MKTVDFYALERSVQDKLLVAFAREFDPKPILWRHGTRPTAALWLGFAALGLALLIALWALGFGELGSALARHPAPAALLYLALVAAATFGVVSALAIRTALGALPFAPGVYLFPANVIDARDRHFRVFPLAELGSVTASGGQLVVTFGAERFAFAVEPASAERAVTLVEEAARTMRGELSDAELRERDPLEPPIIGNPLGSTVPMASRPPSWVKYRWGIVLGAGALLGTGLFYLRNHLSDGSMFAAARAKDDVAAYRSYLERGRRFREQVARVMLPRAALRLAVADGSVEAIEAFAEEHPDTDIEQEVELARRTALVAAFEKARAAGTLTALSRFAASYPQHGLDSYLKDATHAIYTRAFERYRNQMPKGADEVGDFVKRLIAYAERVGPRITPDGARGPTLSVRVRRLPSEEIKRADDLVMKNPLYAGVSSLPSRYLKDEHCLAHEERIAAELAKALGRGFDPEVLAVSAGARLGGEGDLPAAKEPTLVVSYRLEPSGAAYATKRPRGIFFGLVFRFTVEAMLPGDDKHLSLKHSFQQEIPVDLITQQRGQPPRGELETKIYQGMLREAFDEAARYIAGKWIAPAD